MPIVKDSNCTPLILNAFTTAVFAKLMYAKFFMYRGLKDRPLWKILNAIFRNGTILR